LTTPAWIRNVTVVLWIDQEGFRSIQPKFELIGYSGKMGRSPDGHPLDVAAFAMKEQQTGHFHHAVSSFILSERILLLESVDYLPNCVLDARHPPCYAASLSMET